MQVKPIHELRTKLFADGADLNAMLRLYANPCIKGFTTNPTLMRKAGISNYEKFAREVLDTITDRPLSLEVFADDILGMERQARLIGSWANNVYVKLPITNTRSESTLPLVKTLSRDGIKVNVTAILTQRQIAETIESLALGAPSCVSVFAGRIADTGRDPLPIMAEAVHSMIGEPQIELIWASPRELLNIYQADCVGCHIITATTDILNKLGLIGKDLETYSLDTVQMFYEDGRASGYSL